MSEYPKILVPVIKRVWPELKVFDIINGDSGVEIFKQTVQLANDMGYKVVIEESDSPIVKMVKKHL